MQLLPLSGSNQQDFLQLIFLTMFSPALRSPAHCGLVPSPGKLRLVHQVGHKILGWDVGFAVVCVVAASIQ